ncbi:MAG: response regulator [Candidatus Melainabacteria bacterium]|nr:response regulator [Candidatus Melainabacteria bacterium]
MPEKLILLVEDDPTLRMVFKRVVAHLGHACQTASSGEEAVSLASENFTLIFMDVGLPGISGEDATQLIRKQEEVERRPRTPIVALTGHANREQCLKAGMDDFLQKPALIEDVRKMIEKHTK